MLHTLELKQLRVASAEPVDLRLASGECLMIEGPSGSGKSRLLRAIADLDPSDGLMLLNQNPLENYPATEWRSAVGLLAAEPVWWAETVAEHFLPNVEQASQIGLSQELFTRPIKQLSSGERQRFALLRALDVEPQFLLLDEPTSQLDEQSTLSVEALLQGLMAEEKLGLIWVSHDSAQRSRQAGRLLSLAATKVAR